MQVDLNTMAAVQLLVREWSVFNLLQLLYRCPELLAFLRHPTVYRLWLLQSPIFMARGQAPRAASAAEAAGRKRSNEER